MGKIRILAKNIPLIDQTLFSVGNWIFVLVFIRNNIEGAGETLVYALAIYAIASQITNAFIVNYFYYKLELGSAIPYVKKSIIYTTLAVAVIGFIVQWLAHSDSLEINMLVLFLLYFIVRDITRIFSQRYVVYRGLIANQIVIWLLVLSGIFANDIWLIVFILGSGVLALLILQIRIREQEKDALKGVNYKGILSYSLPLCFDLISYNMIWQLPIFVIIQYANDSLIEYQTIVQILAIHAMILRYLNSVYAKDALKEKIPLQRTHLTKWFFWGFLWP